MRLPMKQGNASTGQSNSMFGHTTGFILFLLTFAAIQQGMAQFVPMAFMQKSSSPTPLCPANYVVVPALPPYTTQNFCVAKYEMKNVGNVATAQSSGSPWVNMDRDESITACQNLGAGYDLISNAQWQTIARNIADTAWNWSSSVAYSGQLNFGHADGSPSNTLAASTDTDACSGTGQTCSDSVWDSQRRTNKLSNDSVIWDLGGNVYEWVKDNNSSSQGANGYVSTFNSGDNRQINYGNDQFCASPGSTPYCGFGHGTTNASSDGVIRGGLWSYGGSSGVFFVRLNYGATFLGPNIGFRCVSAITPL